MHAFFAVHCIFEALIECIRDFRFNPGQVATLLFLCYFLTTFEVSKHFWRDMGVKKKLAQV